MINLNVIKQSIVELDYAWNKPHSLIVLIPGLSLIIQKIQVASLVTSLENKYKNLDQLSDLEKSREYTKLNNVYQWHVLGSLIQTITLLALSHLFPVFLISAALSLYEMFSSINGLFQETIIYQNENLHLLKG